MRIIHTGDIHLGSPMGNLPPEKARLRSAELVKSFRELTEFAMRSRVDVVLIAGDLFDENTVSHTLRKETLSCIAEAENVDFFYISGNHDDEFKDCGDFPDNFYTFRKPQDWVCYSLREEVTLSAANTKDLHDGLYKRLCLRKDKYNIVMLHGDVYNKDTFGISLSGLQNQYIDYLALGHIHKPDLSAIKLDDRGKYRYCGCLEGRGFDECGDRGFFLLEIENGKLVKEDFYSLARRKVWEVRVDVSACAHYYDVERAAFAALKDVSDRSMVKLVLCGRHKAALKKDISLLTARLNEEFFFARVEDESKVFIDYESYKNDLSERGEFVREVGRCALNEEMRLEILDVGLKALAGEDIDL